jgi:uncharacterized protein (DUF1778 family)
VTADRSQRRLIGDNYWSGRWKRLASSGNLPYDLHMSATARLEARLPAEIHAMLKRAAEIEGRSLTDFVVSAAQEAARRTLSETHVIRLSMEDQIRFAEALLNPGPPTRGLIDALRLNAELIDPD